MSALDELLDTFERQLEVIYCAPGIPPARERLAAARSELAELRARDEQATAIFAKIRQAAHLTPLDGISLVVRVREMALLIEELQRDNNALVAERKAADGGRLAQRIIAFAEWMDGECERADAGIHPSGPGSAVSRALTEACEKLAEIIAGDDEHAALTPDRAAQSASPASGESGDAAFNEGVEAAALKLEEYAQMHEKRAADWDDGGNEDKYDEEINNAANRWALARVVRKCKRTQEAKEEAR